MKPIKQVCDFGIKNFNKIKRKDTEVAFAPRPNTGGGNGKGKPSKGDTTAPTISNITVIGITATSATITWTTNEETTGVVQYGTTTSYGLSKTSTGTTSHSATITGLTSGAGYNFRVVSTDLAGNVSFSGNLTLDTAGDIPNVLYLEFYGTIISNTMWNVSGPINATHSGFTEEEIDEIVARITYQYSDFNIVVTNDINVYNNTPVGKKQRVVFTQAHEWYGSGAGGVAYVNSWGWSDQSPGFVFTTLLGYNVHNVAEAGSHEAGHILGLRHQVTCVNGVITSDYNWGDSVSAPIMGASYNVPYGQWWIGPSSIGCDRIQDDTALLTAKIGLS